MVNILTAFIWWRHTCRVRLEVVLFNLQYYSLCTVKVNKVDGRTVDDRTHELMHYIAAVLTYYTSSLRY